MRRRRYVLISRILTTAFLISIASPPSSSWSASPIASFFFQAPTPTQQSVREAEAEIEAQRKEQEQAEKDAKDARKTPDERQHAARKAEIATKNIARLKSRLEILKRDLLTRTEQERERDVDPDRLRRALNEATSEAKKDRENLDEAARARRKLRNMGLSDREIEEWRETLNGMAGESDDGFPPINGVVNRVQGWIRETGRDRGGSREELRSRAWLLAETLIDFWQGEVRSAAGDRREVPGSPGERGAGGEPGPGGR